ncbi:MAG: AAA family ATPase [Chlamydiota bacterium]
MLRSIESELKSWKEDPHRYPLLLRGARQVGKTYIVEKFGKLFESFQMVNFESQSEAIACFSSLDPVVILQKLELLTKRPIQVGTTLLFLDEIQMCPQAIVALRYFKEKMPSLHVIGAGSLLEFALVSGKFSFPVGRVQFMYLYPLSFLEFVLALDGQESIDRLNSVELDEPFDKTIHEGFIHKTKEYFLTGGMPAVVSEFQNTRSFLKQSRIQDLLLATYHADFSKYATEAEQKYLRILFEGITSQIGQHFKYASIDPHIKSRELKQALDQLKMAGLIHFIFSSSASGIPLSSQIKSKKFKTLFLDLGLMQRALQVDPELLLSNELIHIHRGALAEQFVGQELLSYTDCFREEKLFFWEREHVSSSAEVDYVITVNQAIIPIEVKAGSQGHLKSLMQFIKEKKSPLGIRISERPLEYRDGILSVPFYMVKQIPRLVTSLL